MCQKMLLPGHCDKALGCAYQRLQGNSVMMAQVFGTVTGAPLIN